MIFLALFMWATIAMLVGGAIGWIAGWTAGAVVAGVIMIGSGTFLFRWWAQAQTATRLADARKQRRDAHGLVIDATIVEATQPMLGLVGVGDKLVIELRVEATLANGKQVEIETNFLADLIEMPRLQPGCTVALRYDPADVSNFEVSLLAFRRKPVD